MRMLDISQLLMSMIADFNWPAWFAGKLSADNLVREEEKYISPPDDSPGFLRLRLHSL